MKQRCSIFGLIALASIGLAAGAIGGSLAELREVAAASTRAVTYEPSGAEHASETYARFLAVTGLRAQTSEPAAAGP